MKQQTKENEDNFQRGGGGGSVVTTLHRYDKTLTLTFSRQKLHFKVILIAYDN